MKDIITRLKKYRILIWLLGIDLFVIYLLFYSEYESQYKIFDLLFLLLIFLIFLSIFVILDYRALLEIISVTEKMVRGNYERIRNQENTMFIKLIKNINLISIRVENLEKQKDSFIADISHELRTPISTMKILAESIRHSKTENLETYNEFFSDIIHELNRMNEMISDLMTSVNLGPSNYVIRLRPTYLNYLCETVIKQIRPMAEVKNIEIQFIEDADIQIMVDFAKITRVLRNLIENSIKYSPDNSEIVIRLFQSVEYACISVKDEGIGIPLSDLGRIFERFYRVDKARSRESGGCGLGLYITKNIIDMHEGEIFVDSIEGKGSKFTIKLPIK